jgi:predicted nucleotidyltransferase
MSLVLFMWLAMTLVGFPNSVGTKLLTAFIIIHSISWLLIGNFWVYMLDSFYWVKNPGIDSIIYYVEQVRLAYRFKDSAKAILIYGSMCRNSFHNRSDLDLRVIRRKGIKASVVSIFIGFFVRTLAFIRRIPVDLQIVDSECFLEKQMRPDEFPIIVYLSPDFKLKRKGIGFDKVKKEPSIVLRSQGR